MDRIAVIHQPDFLPYIGFFHRLLHSDLLVLLDTVQFTRGSSKSWQNRDLIKTSNGEKWLTISVEKAPMSTKIKDVLLSKNNWKEKNLNQIFSSYKETEYFSEIMPSLEKLYSLDCEKMVEFNYNSILMILEMLDIRIEIIFASEISPVGTKNEMLVDILKKVQANKYLSGVGARSYFDPLPFEKANIEVIWQEFNHPIYRQLHGEFIPFLSIIDMLFNCGIQESRKIIREC